MYAQGYISREDEAQIPDFSSHDEARDWFKLKYNNSFQLETSQEINGQKLYFYFLILDHEKFFKGQQEMTEKGFIGDALEYLGSYQKIEIYEDGSIHIVH